MSNAWTALAEKNEKRVDELQNKYPDINLGSGKQVAKMLMEEGYKLPKTEKGNYKTDIKTLERLDESEIILDKLEYAAVKKLASTYGKKIIKNFVEPDGRIWGNFNLNGASTGNSAVTLQTLKTYQSVKEQSLESASSQGKEMLLLLLTIHHKSLVWGHIILKIRF